MIGVLAHARDLEIAAELFELFKTPWEPFVSGRHYDAVLSTDHPHDQPASRVRLLFADGETDFDRAAGIDVRPAGDIAVEWDGWTFPIFGGAALFKTQDRRGPVSDGASLEYAVTNGGCRTVRVGYDLFAEVRHLLTVGQPESAASVPTLELHIALLRRWLRESGVTFAELLPRPAAHDFICCLTHDIDFVGVRRHLFDRTFLGFIVRASAGTALDVVRGRRPVGDLLTNLGAVARLPLVGLGLARDLWQPFEDYARVEDGRHSTFFVVPFRDRPGTDPSGRVNSLRAVRYGLREVGADVQAAVQRGSEVGIHGIDAWRDAEAGRTELEQLSGAAPMAPGIRMHWLYFSADSPKCLETAGFAYDSTWGYNGQIGYRAGTTQVFRLQGTEGLLELPLAIMDSALLSADRMGLSQARALDECRRVIAGVRQFGGTLVINWHCRSLAPERLWGALYGRLLAELRDGRTLFTTARQAVDWFRWRRSARFSEVKDGEATYLRVSAPATHAHAGVVRIYKAGPGEQRYDDFTFDGTTLRLPMHAA